MAIQVTNPDSIPPLVYDRVHLIELQIKQPNMQRVDDQPVYQVMIRYKMYAVDNDGNIHYHNKIHWIVIDDYIQAATVKAASGDMDMLNALGGIEIALTTLIADQNVHGGATTLTGN